MGINLFKFLVYFTNARIPLFVLIIRQVFRVLIDEFFKLREQGSPLNIAVEDVLKDGDGITLDLLLYLQDMNVCGETLDLTTTDGIDQARFTDTVSADESVFSTLNEPQRSVLKESLATDDDVDS